jgi:hypothetical protein
VHTYSSRTFRVAYAFQKACAVLIVHACPIGTRRLRRQAAEAKMAMWLKAAADKKAAAEAAKKAGGA